MEENKNIEIEETNLVPVEENEYDEVCEEEGGSIVPVIAGSVLAAGAVAAFVLRKKIAAKLESRSVNKLRAKGYYVEAPEEDEDFDDEVVYSDDEETK